MTVPIGHKDRTIDYPEYTDKLTAMGKSGPQGYNQAKELTDTLDEPLMIPLNPGKTQQIGNFRNLKRDGEFYFHHLLNHLYNIFDYDEDAVEQSIQSGSWKADIPLILSSNNALSDVDPKYFEKVLTQLTNRDNYNLQNRIDYLKSHQKVNQGVIDVFDLDIDSYDERDWDSINESTGEQKRQQKRDNYLSREKQRRKIKAKIKRSQNKGEAPFNKDNLPDFDPMQDMAKIFKDKGYGVRIDGEEIED